MIKGAIIDVEASGLGPTSYPVEVGIAFLDSDASWSALIRPEPDWLDGEWDEIAAEVHGITMEELQEQGRPTDLVARELWAKLDGYAVYSDAPLQDGRWLERLREAAWPPLPPLPLPLRHVADLLPPDLAQLCRASDVAVERLHRAEGDAAALRRLVLRLFSGEDPS